MPRLGRLGVLAKAGLCRIGDVQIPVQWCHASAKLRKDARRLLLRSSYMVRVWLPCQAAAILRTDSPNFGYSCVLARTMRS